MIFRRRTGPEEAQRAADRYLRENRSAHIAENTRQDRDGQETQPGRPTIRRSPRECNLDLISYTPAPEPRVRTTQRDQCAMTAALIVISSASAASILTGWRIPIAISMGIAGIMVLGKHEH